MKPDDEKRLREIEERANAATPDEWEAVNPYRDPKMRPKYHEVHCPKRDICIGHSMYKSDAIFVAEARADIPWLIERLREAEKAGYKIEGNSMTDISEIRKEKDAAYGDPKEALGRIGGMWTLYLATRWSDPDDWTITPDMVADMMMLMKIMRRANPSCPSESLVDCGEDIAVYADIASETDARIKKNGV